MTLIDAANTSALVHANRRAQLRTLIDQRTAGNIAAFAEQFGYSRSRVSQFLSETYNEGRSIGERAARAMEEAASLPFGWLDQAAVVPRHARTTDHATELQRAIAETRIVFESEPTAGEVLGYLEAVLAASAPAPAQTGTAGQGLPADYMDLITSTGRVDASIAEETHTAAGGAPVVGAAQQATTTADQAAAAMAAESAQLVADAEKAAASVVALAAVDPLAALSREVFSLADKLQQPVDLVVQRMVLAELRGMRAGFNQQESMAARQTAHVL